MGLDGISINQLRSTPEYNSSEANSLARINANDNKIVDGLSNGQRVDPDKKNKHNSNQQAAFDNDNNEDDNTPSEEDIVKYDLSDANKYLIEVDDITNNVTILDKNTKKVVQSIGANDLMQLIQFAPNSCGSIISKRF